MTPFLFIPGLNCDARVYAAATAALWRHGSVMVANHLSGEGVEGIAQSILAAAPPTFALGGFSMGGYLAFEILRQAPERVAKLALIDTRAEADSTESIENRRRRIALAEAGKFGLVIAQSFPDSVHDDHIGDDRLRAMHTAMATANGAGVYTRHQRAIIGRPDSRPLLASIAVPTVIVVGEGDKITPPSSSRVMHETIAGSTLNVIPGGGHLALLEQPDAVAAALEAWAAA